MTPILSGWSNRWPNGLKCTQAEISSRHGALSDAVHMWQKVFEGKHPALAELQAASFRRGRCALHPRYIKEHFITTN
jgi:hypothetical protein